MEIGVGRCDNVSKYEKLNRVGEGTYGVVYRAREKETGVIVALKKVVFHDAKEGYVTFHSSTLLLLSLLPPLYQSILVLLVDFDMDTHPSFPYLLTNCPFLHGTTVSTPASL
jgi:serine/threonine protein kinase